MAAVSGMWICLLPPPVALSQGAPPVPPLDVPYLPIDPCQACAGLIFWRWPTADPRHLADAWHCLACEPVPHGSGPVDACSVPRQDRAGTYLILSN
jgi:hypothetical protein